MVDCSVFETYLKHNSSEIIDVNLFYLIIDIAWKLLSNSLLGDLELSTSSQTLINNEVGVGWGAEISTFLPHLLRV